VSPVREWVRWPECALSTGRFRPPSQESDDFFVCVSAWISRRIRVRGELSRAWHHFSAGLGLWELWRLPHVFEWCSGWVEDSPVGAYN